MSFFSLLILLSLIAIIPIFFVIQEKSKRAQANSVQQHQAYLAAASQAITDSTDSTSSNEDTHHMDVITFSEDHPLITLLYDERVPETFRAIITDIGHYYESTHYRYITDAQLFTLNKLISNRIPELMMDYLSVETEYAQTALISNDDSTTSYTIVLDQLHSILAFAKELNTQSQSGVVNKLLASQRYLKEVCQASGATENGLEIKQ